MVLFLLSQGETASEALPGWAAPYLSDSKHICQTAVMCAVVVPLLLPQAGETASEARTGWATPYMSDSTKWSDSDHVWPDKSCVRALKGTETQAASEEPGWATIYQAAITYAKQLNHQLLPSIGMSSDFRRSLAGPPKLCQTAVTHVRQLCVLNLENQYGRMAFEPRPGWATPDLSDSDHLRPTTACQTEKTDSRTGRHTLQQSLGTIHTNVRSVLTM